MKTLFRSILGITAIGTVAVGMISLLASVDNPSSTLQNAFIKTLLEKVESYNTNIPEDRVYVHFDKPFYKPGEDIWFSAYVRDGITMKPSTKSDIVHVDFIDPKGNTAKTINIIAQNGIAKGDFTIGEEAPGGLYKVKAYTNWQKNDPNAKIFEKTLQVQKVVLPTLKMEMDFERKAYGPGDHVEAELEVHTNSNEALANHPINFTASLEGKKILNEAAQTDEAGKVMVTFDLPKDLATNDGLLNVMIAFEGKTESISRSIPILLNNMDLSFYPEGGDLVAGLRSRVAFTALNEFGKPADVEGEVIDESGNVITHFKSYHHGMGAFYIRPEKGEDYTVRITKPESIKGTFQLPEAQDAGFVMEVKSNDRVAMEVAIHASHVEPLTVVTQMRGKVYHTTTLDAYKGLNFVTIPTSSMPVGVAQITIFDSRGIERSERLAFVNKNRQLNIEVATDKQQYLPREKVTMTLKVKDDKGLPMPAHLSMAVVNDQLLTFANDRSSNILSSLLLEADVDLKVDEPKFYFDPEEEKAEKALDYLMLTSGWRRFTWEEVLEKDLPAVTYQGERAVFSGTVLDAYSRKPVKNAKVSIAGLDQKVQVNDKGEFTLSGVHMDGTKLMTVQAGSYTAQNRNVYNYQEGLQFFLYPQQPNVWTNSAGTVTYTTSEAAPRGGAGRAVSAKRSRSMAGVPMQADFDPAPQVLSSVEIAVEVPEMDDEMAPMDGMDMPMDMVVEEHSKKAQPVNNIRMAEQKVVDKLVVNGKIADERNVDFQQELGVQKNLLRSDDLDQSVVVKGDVAMNHLFKEEEKVPMFDVQNLNGKAFANANFEAQAFNPQQQQGNRMVYYRAREYAAPEYDSAENVDVEIRDDFRSTIYWNGDINVDHSGKATVQFFTSDEVTSFNAVVEGIGKGGLIGRQEHKFFAQMPFTMSTKVPTNVATGDFVSIPLTLKNNTKKPINGIIKIQAPEVLKAMNTIDLIQKLAPGEVRTLYMDYAVQQTLGKHQVEIVFKSCGMKDAFREVVEVAPKGFPVTASVSGEEIEKEFVIDMANILDGSIQATLTAYPSVVSDLMTGVEGILREPSGCFEQTSMSSYPNAMVMDYLKATESDDKATLKRAEQLLDKGYKRLVTFETNQKGYEWFGQAPAHEGLTAYGLMQFNDYKEVYASVDDKMIDRTAQWLMSQRDGNGGWKRNTKAYHNFGQISEDIMNGYIVYALAEAGYKDINKELESAYKKATSNKDPYQLGMVANALYSIGDMQRGDKVVNLLLAVQQEDGSFHGTTHSITHSTGQSLDIETTSMVLLAMLKADHKERTAINRAVKYLMNSRSGYGTFGNTQGTIMALKAMTEFAKASKRTKESGTLTFWVDNKKVAEQPFAAGQQEPIELKGLEQYMGEGKNKLKIKYEGVKEALPYSLAVSWTTLLPNSSPECAVALTSKLSEKKAAVGETVRLSTKITNTTKDGLPSTIAIIGIPAGLSAQAWQLKEMQEKGVFDFYEVRDNNVVAYYRGMAPEEVKEINLDLKAEVPGKFDAPASCAYLYYTNEFKSWAAADRITVTQ